MALIHNMSEECIKSELDLFTVPLTQTAIEKNAYIEVPPLSAISDTAPLVFFIAGTGEDYIDLNNTLLFLRVKITNPNGTDIADGAPVGHINYAGATIFPQVDVSLGDRLISQSTNAHPYRCLIECLLNYDKHTLETVFSAGLFYKDHMVTWMLQTPLEEIMARQRELPLPMPVMCRTTCTHSQRYLLSRKTDA
ncbi:hypothetical protein M9458_056826 [Cirrhinus mrigala]|uniref:Uncharacterized protein n=1 Tax=Cirrhinus mrigala TaxID=683832 RepID=A0ABD0MGL1_CIRMR